MRWNFSSFCDRRCSLLNTALVKIADIAVKSLGYGTAWLFHAVTNQAARFGQSGIIAKQELL